MTARSTTRSRTARAKASLDDAAQAKSDALKLLSFRPRSRQELRERLLEKGYAPPLVDELLVDFERRRLVQDKDFATLWATHRMETGKYGSQRIKQELKAKGIDDATASASLRQTAEHVDELETAVAAAQKHLRHLTDVDLLAKKRRLWGFLSRRGFPNDIVTRAIEHVCNH